MMRGRMLIYVQELLALAARNPDGFTYQDVERDLGWEALHFYNVVRKARRVLAEQKQNLPCVPEGWHGRWRYRLTGEHEPISRWTKNRLGTVETALQTVLSLAHSEVRHTNARTVAGRRCRLIVRVVEYLLQELRALDEEEAG